MKYREYYEYLAEVRVSKNVVKVPAEPGSVSIPSDHIRLYHYTTADVDELMRNGLMMSKARGSTYGEPNMIWASSIKPGGHKTYVEFSVSKNDERFGINDPRRMDNFDVKYPRDYTFLSDIKPQEFIAIHEPWHNDYRYIVDDNPDMIDDVLAGKYDYLIDRGTEDVGRAIQAIKINYGE